MVDILWSWSVKDHWSLFSLPVHILTRNIGYTCQRWMVFHFAGNSLTTNLHITLHDYTLAYCRVANHSVKYIIFLYLEDKRSVLHWTHTECTLFHILDNEVMTKHKTLKDRYRDRLNNQWRPVWPLKIKQSVSPHTRWMLSMLSQNVLDVAPGTCSGPPSDYSVVQQRSNQ